MSRFNTYIDFNNKQADDVVEILDQVGVTVSVYRQPDQVVGSPGFDREVSSPVFLRNILAYMQPEGLFKGNAARQVVSDAGRGTEIRMVGITMDKDVRVRDIWKMKGKEYVIESIDDANVAKTEVKLVRKI